MIKRELAVCRGCGTRLTNPLSKSTGICRSCKVEEEIAQMRQSVLGRRVLLSA